MKTAVIYSRVSTEEQAKEGQSIEGQVNLCKQYAEQNHIDVVEIYKDEGKSATNTNRPALQAMLERISEDKSIDCVLVQDTDRLARNTLDHLSIKNLLNKHHVDLISISQPLIDSSPEGNFIDTVLAATNALQSQITGRKTSKIMEQKAKAGYWPSIAPKGYINIKNPNPPQSSFDKRIIAPHPDEGPLIKKLFQEYATGNYNLQTLSDKMFSLGFTASHGKPIQPSIIAHILNHPLYYGVVPWKGQIIEGKHEPLVDQTIWDTCQQVLADHNQHASRKRIHDYLLRGYVYCADSDIRYWAGPHKGNGGIIHYYFRKSNPKGTYIEVSELEKQTTELFKDLKMTPAYIEELLATARQVIQELRSSTDTDKQLLVNRQTKISEQMREAEDRLLDKTLTPERYKSIMDRLEKDIIQVGKDLKILNANYAQKFEKLENLANMARDIHNTYKEAEPSMKRYYLGLFIEKILVRDGKIVSAIPSKQIKPLIKNGKILVRVSSNWLPCRQLTTTLKELLS